MRTRAAHLSTTLTVFVLSVSVLIQIFTNWDYKWNQP